MSVGLRVTNGLLLPGKVIGNGRYRLVERVGIDERDGAHLWRAHDGQLGRDVALTILTDDSGAAHQTLERCAHRSGLMHPAIAPVLNVLSVSDGVGDEGVVGVVVAEWTRGTGMTDVVAREPLTPTHACQLLEPLAAAVAQAHHRGVVLGIGHPLRVRVAPSGTLRLAFPGPPSAVGLDDDVRGLGAILYLLLTGRWPATDGELTPPHELQPEVPLGLSEVAMRALVDTRAGGIRTSETILTVLRQVCVDALAPAPDDDNQEVADGEPVWLTKPPVDDSARRKKLAIAVTVLVLMTLGVVLWIGMSVVGIFT
jgi:hypothetical protein